MGDAQSMRMWRVSGLGQLLNSDISTKPKSKSIKYKITVLTSEISNPDHLVELRLTLLRVVTACPGARVAFGPTGQHIVTGGGGFPWKVWGAAGGSAVGAGKTKITAGKA